MMVKATFAGSDWRESKVSEADTVSVATLTDTYRYSGGLDGEGKSAGTMCYVAGHTGTYTGYEQVTGTLDGRTGTFVLRSIGAFEPDAVRAELTVVPGSGTGELAGLSGSGTMFFGIGAEHGTVELDYTLEG